MGIGRRTLAPCQLLLVGATAASAVARFTRRFRFDAIPARIMRSASILPFLGFFFPSLPSACLESEAEFDHTNRQSRAHRNGGGTERGLFAIANAVSIPEPFPTSPTHNNSNR